MVTTAFPPGKRCVNPGLVETGVREIGGRQHPSDKDDCGRVDPRLPHFVFDIGQSARKVEDHLIGPGCLMHNCDWTIFSISGDQRSNDFSQQRDTQEENQRGAMTREFHLQFLAGRHRRAAPRPGSG